VNILVFNCGSSSLKYRLIAMPSERELAGGEAQRVGPKTSEPSRLIHRHDGTEETHVIDMRDHKSAFEAVMRVLTSDARLVPDAMAHRMVHGGGSFGQDAMVDDGVMDELERIQHLAPIHNPPATALLKICRGLYPKLPQIVVFDTGYHATIPEHARAYALPAELVRTHGIRKYGFHGTSHHFVASEAARFLGKPLAELNAVSCHLGSGGASLCAIVNGRSVDNTMGYSPLQGLVMSTRCGDLDPAVTLDLLVKHHGDYQAVNDLLNKQSGVLGLSGSSADIRDVLSGRGEEDGETSRLNLTSQIYFWRIRKYLGAYLAVVEHPDAVIFTDTIGESVAEVRWAACTDMDTFGLRIDPHRNTHPGDLPADVAAVDSPIRILVVATNEELAIARNAYGLLKPCTPNTTTTCADDGRTAARTEDVV